MIRSEAGLESTFAMRRQASAAGALAAHRGPFPCFPQFGRAAARGIGAGGRRYGNDGRTSQRRRSGGHKYSGSVRKLPCSRQIGKVDGFDLSPFDRLAGSTCRIWVRSKDWH
jgi:hypothetical protein